MSALEHIRKRPALVISIIGFALLLFIITGFDSFGRLFSNQDTIAKVDGKSIKIAEYNRAREQRRAEQDRQGAVSDNLDSEVLASLIDEQLINQAMEKVGVTLTDDEMKDYFFGANQGMMAAQMAQYYGFASPEEFYNFAYSSEPGADQARMMWEQFENSVRDNFTKQKYFTMLQGALTANKLDAQEAFDRQTPLTVTAARKTVYSLPDDDFEVTDEEIAAMYDRDKERYAIADPVRQVSVINLEVVPSIADRQQTQAEVLEMIEQLRATEGLAAVNQDYSYSIKTGSGSLNTIDANVGSASRSFIKDRIHLFDTVPAALMQTTGDEYVIGKLLSKTAHLDSINVDFILFDKTLTADSLRLQIAAAEIEIDSIPGVIGSALDNNLDLTTPAFSSFAEYFAAVPAGEYVEVDNPAPLFQALTGQPAGNDVNILARLNKRNAPVEVYEVALITRAVKPSQQTVEDLRNQLKEYVAANPTADQFNANAQDAGMMVMPLRLTPTMLKINKSGEAAKWAWTIAKPGDVSPIYNDANETYFMAVALDGAYENYLPVTDPNVNRELTARVRAQKKAEKLMADYNGKATTVEGYAEAMDTPLDQRTQTVAQARGKEAAALAQAAANPGTMVGPIETTNGIYVVRVDEVGKPHRDYDMQQDARTFTNSAVGTSLINRNIEKVLRNGKKIDYKDIRYGNSND